MIYLSLKSMVSYDQKKYICLEIIKIYGFDINKTLLKNYFTISLYIIIWFINHKGGISFLLNKYEIA